MNEVKFLLGKLVSASERSDAAIDSIQSDVNAINYRQHDIRRDVRDMKREVHQVKVRVVDLETRVGNIPRLETWAKLGAAIGLPTMTLWATGSGEKAVEVLRLILAR